MVKTPIARFRLVSILEGISYILLLFIAMPIKYLADNPLPVKIIGMGHGVLFIVFMVLLYESMNKHNWGNGFSMKLFIASLLPFGTFFMDKKLKTYHN